MFRFPFLFRNSCLVSLHCLFDFPAGLGDPLIPLGQNKQNQIEHQHDGAQNGADPQTGLIAALGVIHQVDDGRGDHAADGHHGEQQAYRRIVGAVAKQLRGQQRNGDGGQRQRNGVYTDDDQRHGHGLHIRHEPHTHHAEGHAQNGDPLGTNDIAKQTAEDLCHRQAQQHDALDRRRLVGGQSPTMRY